MTTPIRALRARTAVLATAILLTALPLSGCSPFGSGSEGGSEGGDGAPVKLNEDGSVPNPLTSLTRQVGDYDVTVDVVQLRRIGKVTRVQFTVTPRSRGTSSKLTSVFFGEGYSSDVSGAYLLDVANLKRYPVLQAKDNVCVCSNHLSDFALDTPPSCSPTSRSCRRR